MKKINEKMINLTRDQFDRDDDVAQIICFNILQIGELTKNLGPEFIKEYNFDLEKSNVAVVELGEKTLSENIMMLLPETGDSADDLTLKELIECRKSIDEKVVDFNLNALDAIVEELSDVKIPEKYDELYAKIKTGIGNVDFKTLKELTWDIIPI